MHARVLFMHTTVSGAVGRSKGYTLPRQNTQELSCNKAHAQLTQCCNNLTAAILRCSRQILQGVLDWLLLYNLIQQCQHHSPGQWWGYTLCPLLLTHLELSRLSQYQRCYWSQCCYHCRDRGGDRGGHHHDQCLHQCCCQI